MDTGETDIPRLVEQILSEAVAKNASDLHVEPEADSYTVRFRIDGLLTPLRVIPAPAGRGIVNRLMVLAELLTYRLDVPQEGRANVKIESIGRGVDLRIAVMPTTHGLRAAIRLPAELTQPRSLDALQLDPQASGLIEAFIRSDTGALLITGPAGSGKTTTAYAILEAIRDRAAGVSIVSLEDPVERDLRGITQIAVQPFGQLTYATALRSMLRQDPQVLMLGEIRDAETASIAIQAALSGHRLICTFHAADPAGAIVRLLEMKIEPYQIASSVFGILSIRLLRRTSTNGAYAGRLPATEAVRMTDAVRKVVADNPSAEQLRASYAAAPGYQSLAGAGQALVRQGLTDQAEVTRVLGQVDP
ncbi:MAG: Flp pilus assembly complex ATPase component TadA [Burkholderiales bacterium]|nr:Flp pilus assembly complex ATPase component TadA [Phycisphaerae bacterium]